MSNLLIVGDGAIGLLFSHFLSTQHNLTVLTRHNTSHDRFYNDNITHEKINATFVNLNQLSLLPKFDMVLFTVKAFQVQSAFSQVKPFLSAQCSIVLSHNGMGNVEELKNEITQYQALYFLTTSMAAFKLNQYSVLHKGHGQSIIGGCNDLALKNTTNTLELLNAIPHLTSSNNIQRLRFEKLLVNIAINPLTALHNIKNGELRAPKYSSMIFNLLTEACHIANAQNLNITLIDALENAYKVMTNTAQNYSSMHQDVINNRATEIMAICGYIRQQGELFNIKTPYNDDVFTKIEAKKSVV